MSNFNVQGRKGKAAFQDTPFYRIVLGTVCIAIRASVNASIHSVLYINQLTNVCLFFLDSVLTNHKTTESEIVSAISSVLKYAPDRQGGCGRNNKESE